MPSEPKNLPGWVRELAPLKDRTITNDDSSELHSIGTANGDFELLRWWPALDEVHSLHNLVSERAQGRSARLTLLGTPDEGVISELATHGWSVNGNHVLLAATTDDVEQVAGLPETATLFEAPMDDYDVVEIADFDAPAGRGRIRFADGFALLSEPEIMSSSNAEQFRSAIIANLAASASRQGLPWLFMVAAADNSAGTRTLRGTGWSNATLITTFTRS
ncbi:hypothetical protein [Paeniglutamicibacter kerguelensis]|uniref:GNAT family N-acetyltransferase n=1 Tax=Paeniglutamicibacter kerguelensis TaxID=254788 RepID=A0ABS4XJU7_9MICC|nr:hypothetical protein [Paeniglutamicibacter kerguelensis]MBP2388553.1 hypothetical protein [Paeniglutamicibacter kerguelensis]